MSIVPTNFWWILGFVILVQAVFAVASWLLFVRLTLSVGSLAGLAPVLITLATSVLLISDKTAALLFWIGIIVWMSAILFHETPRVSAIAFVVGLLLATTSSLMLFKGLPT